MLNEPTSLPDDTVLDLVADDQGDDLTDEERRALHDALSTSSKSPEAGHSAQHRQSWMNCGSGGEPARQNHPEADAQIRQIDAHVE